MRNALPLLRPRGLSPSIIQFSCLTPISAANTVQPSGGSKGVIYCNDVVRQRPPPFFMDALLVFAINAESEGERFQVDAGRLGIMQEPFHPELYYDWPVLVFARSPGRQERR